MVQSLSDLQKLLKILRKQGVTEFRSPDIELKLGDLPEDRSHQVTQDDEVIEDAYAGFPTGMLTETQAIHYANGGIPENDPELNKQ